MKAIKLNIEDLLNELEQLKQKGNKNVELTGTLICPSAGNVIIATTEKQF